MTLASCGIGYPCHNLDVCESRQGGAGPSTTRRMTADVSPDLILGGASYAFNYP